MSFLNLLGRKKTIPKWYTKNQYTKKISSKSNKTKKNEINK